MVSVWELLMPLMFENLYDAKRPMKNQFRARLVSA